MARMRKWLAIASLLLLVAPACQRAGPGAGTASVEITSPREGEAVTVPFDVVFNVSGVEIGDIDAGLDHLHIYVGDDYEVHTSTGPFTVTSAPGGTQPIRVVVARANHQETADSTEVTVTVSGGSPAEAPTPGDYGY